MARTPKKTPDEPVKNTEATPDKWPTRGQAAQQLGLSLATIKRLEKEGELEATKGADGIHRFDPAILEAFRVERGGKPAPETETMIATIDNASSQAKEAGKHTERLIGLVVDPAESLLSMYKEECAALRAYVKELSAENLTMNRELRDILKEAHERELATKVASAKIERANAALGMVKEAWPLLMAQLSGKGGSELLKVVHSLHPDQVKLLFASGLLTAEQQSAFLRLLSQVQKEALSKPSDTSEEETSEGQTGNGSAPASP